MVTDRALVNKIHFWPMADWLPILISLSLLVIGPVVGGEKGTYGSLVISSTICIWRPTPMLFLFLASAGAYFPNPNFGAGGLGMTPTRLMALLLVIRCAVSPGPNGITRAFLLQSPSRVTALVLLFVGLSIGAIVEAADGRLATLILVATTFFTYALLVPLISEVGMRSRLVLAIAAALVVPVAYYPLAWANLLEPIRELRAGPGVDASSALRMAAGASNLNFIAHLMAPLIGLGVYAFLCSRLHVSKYAGLAIALLAFAASLNSGSRVSVVSGGVATLVCIIVAIQLRGFAGIGSSLYFIIIAPIAVVFAWGIIGDNFTMLYERFLYSEQSQRIPHWIFTLDFISHHPIPDYPDYVLVSSVDNAHNTYLEAGLIGGWLGLAGMVWVGGSSLVASIQQIRTASLHHKIWAGAIAAISFSVFCSISFNSIINHKLAWIMIVVLAFRWGYWEESERAVLRQQAAPQAMS